MQMTKVTGDISTKQLTSFGKLAELRSLSCDRLLLRAYKQKLMCKDVYELDICK